MGGSVSGFETGTQAYVPVCAVIDNPLDEQRGFEFGLQDLVSPCSAAVNQPPQVNAGPDQTFNFGAGPVATPKLAGQVTDDKYPGTTLTHTWTQVSGPSYLTDDNTSITVDDSNVTTDATQGGTAVAVFGNPRTLDSTVTLPFAGTYVFLLTASDGQYTASDTVTITATPATPPNQPPAVNAGPDQNVATPSTVTLTGTATDDGLPSGILTHLWTQISGPAVTIVNPTQLVATCAISVPGTYEFQLAASDGTLSASDVMNVQASSAPPLNNPFDFAVLRYQWGAGDGRDLDTRTAVLVPDRENDVGWIRNITDPVTGTLPACSFSPAPADTSPYYLVHGGDNCEQGVEAVNVNFPKLIADFPGQNSFTIRLRAFWYNAGYDPTANPPRDGIVTVQFQTYLGGAMSHVGYDFVNTGGTVVDTVSLPCQIYTNFVGGNVDGDDIATLVYNPSTKLATIIPAPPLTAPSSIGTRSALNSTSALTTRSASVKS